MTSKQEVLVLDNMWRVRVIAGKLKGRLPQSFNGFEELVSSGNVGLVEAAMRYKEGTVLFQSFASLRIHGAMLDYLRSIDLRTRDEHKAGIVRHQVPLKAAYYVSTKINTSEIFSRLTVDKLLTTLPKQLATLIQFRYFKGLTQSQTGVIMGYSATYIFLLEQQALGIMKSAIAAEPEKARAASV